MVNFNSLDLESIVEVHPHIPGRPCYQRCLQRFEDILSGVIVLRRTININRWRSIFSFLLSDEDLSKMPVRICCLYLVHVCGADFLYLPKFNISFLCSASISCFAGQENGYIFNKPNSLHSYGCKHRKSWEYHVA